MCTACRQHCWQQCTSHCHRLSHKMLGLLQLGNLYGLLGQLHLQRASSLPAALQARCKKQVSTMELMTAL